jgi:AcrR family transcriptional regulator
MKNVKPRSKNAKLPPASARENTTAARQKPKPRDPLATRAALIGAAAAIFKREGYFATDTNAIARRAGYAPGSFYNHFADKTAILLAVYERYVDLEWRGVRQTAATHPAGRIVSVLDFIEGLHGEWARFRTDIRTVARLEPAVAKVLAASRAKQMDMLAGLTGRSRAKYGPRLLIALTLVERYADLLTEAKTLDLQTAAVKRELAATLTRIVA